MPQGKKSAITRPNRWTDTYPCCRDCGTTERSHIGRGYCSTHYFKRQQSGDWGDPVVTIKAPAPAIPPAAQTAQIETTPATEEATMPEGKWHPKYFACKDCGRTTRPHQEDGVCIDCWMLAKGLKPKRGSEYGGDEGDDGQSALINLARRDVAVLRDRKSPPPLATATAIIPGDLAPSHGFADRVMAAIADEPAPSATAALLDEFPVPTGEIPPDLLYETLADKKPGLFDLFDAPVVGKPYERDSPAPLCGHRFAYGDGNRGPACVLFAGHGDLHSDGDTFRWPDQPADLNFARILPEREHDGSATPLPDLPDECHPPDATPLDPPEEGEGGIVINLHGEPCEARWGLHACQGVKGHPGDHHHRTADNWHVLWHGEDAAGAEYSPTYPSLAEMRATIGMESTEGAFPLPGLLGYSTEALLAELANRYARQAAEIAAGERNREDAARFRQIAAIVGGV